MVLPSNSAVWSSDLVLGQKRRASQAVRLVERPGRNNRLRTKYTPTHPRIGRLSNLFPKGRRRFVMKLTKLYSVVVAMLGMVASAEAGPIVLTSHDCCGAEKSCGCAPSCQPKCCRPVICKPECPNIYNYQRTCAKPQCCNAAPSCAPRCAAPANCAAPVACAPAACAPVTCAA